MSIATMPVRALSQSKGTPVFLCHTGEPMNPSVVTRLDRVIHPASSSVILRRSEAKTGGAIRCLSLSHHITSAPVIPVAALRLAGIQNAHVTPGANP